MSSQLSSQCRLQHQPLGWQYQDSHHDTVEDFEFLQEKTTMPLSSQPQVDPKFLIEHSCDAERTLEFYDSIYCAECRGLKSEMNVDSPPTLRSSPPDLKASLRTPRSCSPTFTPSSPTLTPSTPLLSSSPQTLVSSQQELGTWIPIKWSHCTKCGHESERWNARSCTECGYRRAVIHEPERNSKRKRCTKCRYKHRKLNTRSCAMCGHDREEFCKPEGDFKWRYCTECCHEHEEYETRSCTKCGHQREVFCDRGREIPCLQNQRPIDTKSFPLGDEWERPGDDLSLSTSRNSLCQECGHDRCRNPHIPPEPIERFEANSPERCNICGFKNCGDFIPPECSRSCGYEECAECDGIGVVNGLCGHSKCASCLEGVQSGILPTKPEKKKCKECGMKAGCRGLKRTEEWDAEWDAEGEEDEWIDPIERQKYGCKSCADCKVVFGEVNWEPRVRNKRTYEGADLGPLDEFRQWVEYDYEFSNSSGDQTIASKADLDKEYGFETSEVSEEHEAPHAALEKKFGFGNFKFSGDHTLEQKFGFGNFGGSEEREASVLELEEKFGFGNFGGSEERETSAPELEEKFGFGNFGGNLTSKF